MGKKDKKPKIKLTPEERKALREEKRRLKKFMIEEEGRQRKREILTREIEFGKRSRKILEKEWTQTLLDIKLPILRMEFQHAVNSMERLLDAKDYKISVLMDELDQQEELYGINLRSHCRKIDKLIEVYYSRLDDLKYKYDIELRDLIITTDSEMDYMREKNKDEDENLNTMLYGLSVEQKNLTKQNQSEYLSRLNEETNKNTAELHEERAVLEHTFEKLWETYKTTLKNYINLTSEQQKKYDVLQKQDDWMRNKIKEQAKQIYDSYDLIRRLKERENQVKERLGKEIFDFEEEKKYFMDQFQYMKDTAVLNTKIDNAQLLALAVTSNASIKALEVLLIVGEKILRWMSMIRKYELQVEKFLPFPSLQPENIHVKSTHHPVMKELEAFWQKCGQGDALRMVITEELLYLQEENKFLKDELKNYCRSSTYGCHAMMKNIRAQTVVTCGGPNPEESTIKTQIDKVDVQNK